MWCSWRLASVFLPRPASTFMSAIGCEDVMTFELVLGGVIAIGMLVYLVFALLRPEKF